ncbi:GNAT family N-acetyltransferase [Enterobacter sp. Colony194]|uniref:GNAT family N-acetyltransferase n=1 Tax=Enterobacter sp. Colony194 TaxID=2866201 RepID=UPI001C69C15D|nr:GNAT family N-acetyltransferase [Enterobacter sp. Colony194]
MSAVEVIPVPAIAVRDVQPDDTALIAAIYAWHVQHGRASFEEVPPDAEEMAQRIAHLCEKGYPWLVAEWHGIVVGYCYAAPYRSRPAYRYTVEESIYVDASMTGRGIGRALLEELIARCEQGPWRQMIAIIGDGENNPGSQRLHRQLGFEVVGQLRSVGFKLGNWRDTLIMQRPLNQGDWALPN